MSCELRINSGGVTEATTWVCKVPGCDLPYIREALDHAAKKGVHIGIHVASQSVLLHFPEPQPVHRAQSKLGCIFGKGSAVKTIIECIEALDFYHCEECGLLTPLCDPTMPADYIDTIVEEDELSEDEEHVVDTQAVDTQAVDEHVEPGEQIVTKANIFVLAKQVPKTIRVPDMVKALGMETSYQKDLREAMENAGGPLSKHLKEILFPRGKQHVQDVQDEARMLARKRPADPLFWITSPPAFITVYAKPNMSMSRKVEFICFKAARLNIILSLPAFMLLVKHVTFYTDPTVRMKQFRRCVELWQGASLDWTGLPADEKNLIININRGKDDYYCKNCHRVLNPKSTAEFCSPSCASNFCGCGCKLQVKMVCDDEQLERQQKQLGPYRHLVDLARMLQFKDEVDKYKTLSDVNAKFD